VLYLPMTRCRVCRPIGNVLILLSLLYISVQMLTVNRCSKVPANARALAQHFASQGTPVMIAKGVLASCIASPLISCKPALILSLLSLANLLAGVDCESWQRDPSQCTCSRTALQQPRHPHHDWRWRAGIHAAGSGLQ
jgi:hypothetical protein